MLSLNSAALDCPVFTCWIVYTCSASNIGPHISTTHPENHWSWDTLCRVWHGGYTTPLLYTRLIHSCPHSCTCEESCTHTQCTMYNIQHVRAPGYTYTLSLSYSILSKCICRYRSIHLLASSWEFAINSYCQQRGGSTWSNPPVVCACLVLQQNTVKYKTKWLYVLLQGKF